MSAMRLVRAIFVPAVAAMAFWSSAMAATGEYATFNYCPDGKGGSENHPDGPILKWRSLFRSVVGLTSVKCKEISTCYVGSISRWGLRDGDIFHSSWAGGGRERAYVAALGHSYA